jgi:aromatic-L-amino-acid/L-tryptophan decarboxylase
MSLRTKEEVAEDRSRLHRSLDPRDWSTHRALGHRMVDDMIDWLSCVRTRPTWRKPTAEVQAALAAKLPLQGCPAEEVYEDFRDFVLPHPTGNIHPRFWSHVIGSGTGMGAFAEFLAGSMNCNVFGANQAACRVEEQVLRWLGAMLGYPEQASGILLSGGSMANILGLSIALRTKAGPALRERGLAACGRRFRFYASKETHNSLEKAAEFLGLGRTAFRSIPVDERFQIAMPALRAAIAEDRAEGWEPFCVVGNAVTVGTGAIDPFADLVTLCREQSLWLHVDGAIGALARITPELQPALEAIAEADSIAFDLHKWLHMPYEAGCLMVREGQVHREAFANSTAYLAVLEGGFSSGEGWPNQLGPELSRGFKALKVWMSLKEQGVQAFSEAMSANLAQAAFLADLVKAQSELELLAPVRSSIVNFRHRGSAQASGEETDVLNRRILIELQESGHCVPSHNRIGGKFALRVALCNHRTRPEDLEALVQEVLRLGKKFSHRATTNPSSP